MMWKYKYTGQKEHEFNLMSASIISTHCWDLKKCLEIGAGTGQLSALIKSSNPEMTTTMIDSSQSACNYIRDYFLEKNYRFTIIHADIFNYDKQLFNAGYDIVLSSGLIEHFKNDELIKICNIHKKYSRKYVVIIVPFASPGEIAFAKSDECKKRYGYQKPYTVKELNDLFVDDKFKLVHNEIFYKESKLLIGIYERI